MLYRCGTCKTSREKCRKAITNVSDKTKMADAKNLFADSRCFFNGNKEKVRNRPCAPPKMLMIVMR